MELAGPAGVGKSTLARTLMGRLDGTHGTIWGLPVLPLLVNGLQLIPTFGRLWLHSGSPLWDETRHMVRLRTLRSALERRTGSTHGADDLRRGSRVRPDLAAGLRERRAAPARCRQSGGGRRCGNGPH